MSIQKVDDRDPHITYSTNWQQDGSSHDYNNTVMFTFDANATMTYTFSGESITELHVFMKGFTKFLPGASIISVWGTTPNALPQSGPSPGATYRIDNGTPENTFPNRDLLQNRYQQMFFQSQTLTPDESHTLVVTTLTQGGTFYFDFIQLTLVTPSQTTSVLASGSLPSTFLPESISDHTCCKPTSTSGPSSLQGENISTAYGSAIATSLTNNAASHPSVNAGAIVGGVIGALVIIVVLVGMATAFVFFKRRRARIQQEIDSCEKFYDHSLFVMDFNRILTLMPGSLPTRTKMRNASN